MRTSCPLFCKERDHEVAGVFALQVKVKAENASQYEKPLSQPPGVPTADSSPNREPRSSYVADFTQPCWLMAEPCLGGHKIRLKRNKTRGRSIETVAGGNGGTGQQ